MQPLIEKSKKKHFKVFLYENWNNASLIWKEIQQLIILKSKSKGQTNILTIKTSPVLEILLTLLLFFIIMGPDLSKTNPSRSSQKIFTSFYKNY